MSITLEGGKQVYIYIYIHTSYAVQAHRVGKYMPTSLEHDPKYRYRKVNRSRHTLEMKTNGTKHDIPNTNHLREKGRRKRGVFKEYIKIGRASCRERV